MATVDLVGKDSANAATVALNSFFGGDNNDGTAVGASRGGSGINALEAEDTLRRLPGGLPWRPKIYWREH